MIYLAVYFVGAAFKFGFVLDTKRKDVRQLEIIAPIFWPLVLPALLGIAAARRWKLCAAARQVTHTWPEERYCEVAAKRLAQMQLPLTAQEEWSTPTEA